MAEKPDTRAAERRLKKAEEDARRKKMGEPLNLSDQALDQTAEYRQPEQESVYDYARRNLPPDLRGIIDAEVIERDE